jgi:methylmalonyl-CoA mutase cobalamin-binding domain/chain
MNIEQTLSQALVALDDVNAVKTTQALLKAGASPVEVIEQCRRGMTTAGELYGRGDYYLSELILVADIFQQCMALVEPYLATDKTKSPLGAVVIGTAQGDIHDLGKNIVATLLRCGGFAVTDLGVDVPPQRSVEALSETGARIVGLSCLMTTAYAAMKATVQAIAQVGLRDQVFVVIGGGPIDERVRDYVGADFCALDAMDGIRACQQHIEGRHEK